ncbi:MAG: hypothetical protein U1F11_09305 [Steroidobacteraceae bacterium]
MLPALLAQEAPRLDLLVISDASGFRAAGAGRLLARAPVGAAVFGGGWPGTPDGLAPCRTERRWSWDGVRFLLLPVPAADRPADGGAAGCVLHVSAAGGAGSSAGCGAARRGRRPRAAWPCASAAGERRARAARGFARCACPGFTATLRAGSVLVASRELDAPRRALLARAWAIEPAAVRSTAREGPLQVLATPGRGLRVRAWLAQQPGWRWRVPRND